MTQLPLELLPLELLGAREIVEGVVYFGIILPPTTDGRSALDGYHLWVRVIHEEDQFLKSKKPIEAQLNPGSLSEAACFVYEEINGRSPNLLFKLTAACAIQSVKTFLMSLNTFSHC